MSVISPKIKASYISQGEDEFTIDFPYNNLSELCVTSLNPKTMAEVTLVYEEDYFDKKIPPVLSNTLILRPSGLAKVPAGNVITITRKLPLTQETVLTENDPFYTSTIEKMVDKLTYIALSLKDEIGQAIKYPTGLSRKPDYAELVQIVDKAYNATIKADAATEIAENAIENIEQAADKAMKWASNPLNVEVENGQFSAYHYAMQVKNTNDFATVEDATAGVSELKVVSPATMKKGVATFAIPDYKNKQLFLWDRINQAPQNGLVICKCNYGKASTGKSFALLLADNVAMDSAFDAMSADCYTNSVEGTFMFPVSKGTYFRAVGGYSAQQLSFIPYLGDV